VVRKEVIKLLESRIIYPIADSKWVSLLHHVPKKGGITVVQNDENELLTGYRICIDFRKLNKVTKIDLARKNDSHHLNESCNTDQKDRYQQQQREDLHSKHALMTSARHTP
jgi:hypothetical protein